MSYFYMKTIERILSIWVLDVHVVVHNGLWATAVEK